MEKTENKSSLQGLPRNIWAVTLTSFFTDVSSEMIFNLVPLYLANVLGVGTAIIGLIDGIAETTASLMKVYAGSLSDKLGQRKWLAVAGYALSTISKPFLFIATTWEAVLGVRFSDRLGKGIRTAPRDALVADSIDEKQRGLAFGVHRAGDTAGAFLGLGFAALIVWLTEASGLDLTRHTFQIAVLISFVPALLGVLVLIGGANEVPMKTRRASARPSFEGLEARFRLFLFVVLLFTLGNSSDSFIILLGQNRGLDIVQIMLMLMTFNFVYAALSGPLGAWSDAIGRRSLIIGGWIAYGLVYLGLALSKAGWQVWVLYGLYGIYYAATDGVARALVADFVPLERRGAAYGLYNAAIGITVLPASVIAGILWQGIGGWTGFGASAPFLFGAAMALLAGVLFWRLVPSN
ncbi:MAG TPA: MFS transporter [Anaerolineales bacterium]|nr:MFS transporter [Anaerolineales bacterium]